MARIVVTGYMIRHPVAGNILAFFQYLMGLHLLGHQVIYVEESGWSYSCYNPDTREWQDSPEAGLKIVQGVLAKYKLNIPLCYVNPETGNVVGIEWNELKQLLKEADLLLNTGGVCWLPEFRLCNRRALIDMDPLFTQAERFGAEILNDYHMHFSYGVNIGHDNCTIPTRGINWLPLFPPVVPELWRNEVESADAAFTTIGNWGSYGGVTYNGEYYGQKDEEFLRIIDLPQHTSQKLELVMSGVDKGIMNDFLTAGWIINSNEAVRVDLSTYQTYIINSKGEFSAAKNAYVKTNSGWFSDRSVCYLAAGLPVVLQNTGFTDWLPSGNGVLAFSSLEEAIDCIEKVNADYLSHRRAASDIAENVFNYKVVLSRLVDVALGAKLSNSSIIKQGGIK